MSRPKTIALKAPALISLVMAGESVKAAACDLGLAHQQAYKQLKFAGFACVYLSPVEQARVKRNRAGNRRAILRLLPTEPNNAKIGRRLNVSREYVGKLRRELARSAA